ncbi:hypothetical protein [Steroidobacter sp.]|uniref:hypothetical protein n=1 Tax=Steroidobacter sp. TaxID=1978227 RepID=UPI001A634736|nr:hypothetical protein [Steroidobacter sp.]MBL8267569.1 hypothetical protein [Steroidobacter sp.]
MNPVVEISIDLTAQELTDPANIAPLAHSEIEVDDICEFDPLLKPQPAANNDGAVLSPADPKPDPALDTDTIEIEIELSAPQMDALLSGELV